MSSPRRPKRQYGSAKRKGTPVLRPPVRRKGDYRSAKVFQ